MTEWQIIEYLLATEDLLPPLQQDGVLPGPDGLKGADVFLSTRLKNQPSEDFSFLVEVKSRNTPQVLQGAIAQIKSYVKERDDPDISPMIVVPYLSDERLQELEREQVSGIDLCGNGVVTVPQRGLLIYRTGNKNQYPESRAVSNPFQGKSAMVARVFLSETVLLGDAKIKSLEKLHKAILDGGAPIALSQVSKALSALKEECLIGDQGESLYLLDPDKILEKLSNSWKPAVKKRTYLRVADPLNALLRLNEIPEFKWSITGESSVNHYTPFTQAGSIKVAVTSFRLATEALRGEDETVANFADVELVESDEPGYYFENQIDEQGLRRASLLQCWIELRNGDARQQDAARAVRDLIITPSS